MATVFMKWLETNPKNYDRGIQWLTLGKIQRIKERIANNYIRPGTRVLEIGCGTGTLTLMMAQHGATVTGIDASPRMLVEAEKKVKAAKLEERVSLKYLDAGLIEDRFPAASFDLIVSTLVFSELPPEDQHMVLQACQKLLAPDGRLLIAGTWHFQVFEVCPQGEQRSEVTPFQQEYRRALTGCEHPEARVPTQVQDLALFRSRDLNLFRFEHFS